MLLLLNSEITQIEMQKCWITGLVTTNFHVTYCFVLQENYSKNTYFKTIILGNKITGSYM
jgi:hypothetical protein